MNKIIKQNQVYGSCCENKYLDLHLTFPNTYLVIINDFFLLIDIDNS